MKRTFIFILSIFIHLTGFSQAKIRTLPRNINMPSYDSFYPAISGDGNSMVYTSNFTDEGNAMMMYTYKVDGIDWEDPADVSRSINQSHLLFEGGYSLNFDGKTLFFTSKKSGGLGGFDVWYSNFSGGNWQGPMNVGKNINTGAQEGMPSMSSSGEELYFCRCETMTAKKAEGCEILVSKIKGSTWQEAVALPANINSFQPQAPRILADNETLVFTSFKGGSADLYLTRKQMNGNWSNPIPMSFANTSENEQFVSIAAKGRYLYHDVKSGNDRAIEMLLIPDEFKAKSIMHVIGSVVDANSGQGIPATVKVYNVATRERLIFNEFGENGQFNFALTEGNSYDFSVESKDDSFAYFSKIYDLTDLSTSTRDEMKVELSTTKSRRPIELGALTFVDRSAEIDDNSTYELRRLLRLLKSNKDSKFELKVHRYEYFEDSVASLADLTEVIIDTTWSEIEKVIQVMDTIQVVDTVWVNNDSSSVISDSTIAIANSMAHEIDSLILGQRIDVRDSIIMIPHMELDYTYHNDRTAKQAETLVQYLDDMGIPKEQFKIVTSKTSDSPPRGVREIVVTIKLL